MKRILTISWMTSVLLLVDNPMAPLLVFSFLVPPLIGMFPRKRKELTIEN